MTWWHIIAPIIATYLLTYNRKVRLSVATVCLLFLI